MYRRPLKAGGVSSQGSVETAPGFAQAVKVLEFRGLS